MAGARPAISRPAANRTRPMTYGMAGPRRSASRPATTMPTTLASMNALNTQPYRSRPPSWRATMGMTVTTASASEAMNVIVSTRPVTSARYCGTHRPPPPAAGDGPARTGPAGTGPAGADPAGDGSAGSAGDESGVIT